MRFLPQIPSSAVPGPWVSLSPLALAWEGGAHPDWTAALRRGAAVHVVHLPGQAPLDEGLAVLQAGLGPDFLVLPTGRPASREAGFRLLGQLEALLEATSGRGVKLALKVEGGAELPVVDLLRQARAEAVGYCWHPGTADAEALADRLWCGLCEPDSDLGPLQRLGYRWDMALPARDPETFLREAAALGAAHPPVLFPAELPTVVMGRPVVPDEGLVFGKHWDCGERP